MKKDQNLPNKIIHSDNSIGKPLPNDSNFSRNQLPFNSSYRGRSPEQRYSQNVSQKRYSRSNSQIISIETTIYDKIQEEENILLIPVATQTLGIDTIQAIDQETHLTIDTGIIPTKEIGAIQIIEINVIKTTDQEIIQTTDQTDKDPTTITIRTDHEITRKVETQTMTINKGIILNPLIGITTVTPIPKTSKEATHQNIKGNLFKYKQLKKQIQTPLVSIVQKVLNYN